LKAGKFPKKRDMKICQTQGHVDTGFGLSIAPGLKYRASQNLGIYAGLVYAYSGFNTPYGEEQFNPLYWEIGVIYSFGKYKELFL
jgi:hypothetical protein